MSGEEPLFGAWRRKLPTLVLACSAESNVRRAVEPRFTGREPRIRSRRPGEALLARDPRRLACYARQRGPANLDSGQVRNRSAKPSLGNKCRSCWRRLTAKEASSRC